VQTRHLSLISVDIISDDTFEYQNVTAARVGGFDWSLLFNWNYNLEVGGRKVEAGQPVPTPTMPGGLFSVNREFFLSLGGYDPGKGCGEWRSANLCRYTVKKVRDFPVPSRDVTYQTLPGGE
jgi:hypothetical protein